METKRIATYKHFIVAVFIGLMINLYLDPNVTIVPNAFANITEINYYNWTPYKGVKNFDEWMKEWKKEVNELLRKQRVEWREKFGE